MVKRKEKPKRKLAKHKKQKQAAPDKAQAETKNPGGRPTDYKPEFVEQGCRLAQLGATDREIGEFFHVTERTVNFWKHSHPDFAEALKVGKAAADDRVESCLYRRAVGYSHDAVKIFMPAGAVAPVYAPYTEHVPPDIEACRFWLKNRRKEAWRDQFDHKHTNELPGALKSMSDAQLEEELRAIRAARAARNGARGSGPDGDVPPSTRSH